MTQKMRPCYEKKQNPNLILMNRRDIKESILDVGSGFFLAVLIQLLIFPLFGIKVTIFENFQIALVFTLVSMTRSAIWRWYFRKTR